MKKRLRIFMVVGLFMFSAVLVEPISVSAIMSPSELEASDIDYYDPNAAGGVNCSLDPSNLGIGKDYAGREILNAEQIKQIGENQSVYETAAKEAKIPWQMLAVVHLRETRLKTVNPDNGQGIYQNSGAKAGEYPPGKVSDAEFLKQTKWAANFLVRKSNDPEALANADPDAIKYVFFGYNGMAAAYAAQATALGFTNPADGSPYVMNKADEIRDPGVNPTTWGQIKRDGGPIEYPANGDHGAFVVYASLAGISASGCDSGTSSSNVTGTTREKIVQIAKQELEAWDLNNGVDDYKKYTDGGVGNWCAWFASWVYEEAGVPLVDGSRSQVASVNSGLIPRAKKLGLYHSAGSSYVPQAGDLVVYAAHVNILVVGGSGFDTIGGNEGTSSFIYTDIKQNGGYWKPLALGYIEPPGTSE